MPPSKPSPHRCRSRSSAWGGSGVPRCPMPAISTFSSSTTAWGTKTARLRPSPSSTSCTARARRSGWPRIDLGLRPEGGQGRLARDLDGYGAYFDRWAETWERQALSRARVVAGDRELGARFTTLVDRFVWDRPLGEGEVAAIRRMKARIERERIPAREDPQFHLKLGRGSLSDIEWTVQLLQLRHQVRGSEHARGARDPAPARDFERARSGGAAGFLPVLRAGPEPVAPRRRAAGRGVAR